MPKEKRKVKSYRRKDGTIVRPYLRDTGFTIAGALGAAALPYYNYKVAGSGKYNIKGKIIEDKKYGKYIIAGTALAGAGLGYGLSRLLPYRVLSKKDKEKRKELLKKVGIGGVVTGGLIGTGLLGRSIYRYKTGKERVLTNLDWNRKNLHNPNTIKPHEHHSVNPDNLDNVINQVKTTTYNLEKPVELTQRYSRDINEKSRKYVKEKLLRDESFRKKYGITEEQLSLVDKNAEIRFNEFQKSKKRNYTNLEKRKIIDGFKKIELNKLKNEKLKGLELRYKRLLTTRASQTLSPSVGKEIREQAFANVSRPEMINEAAWNQIFNL